MSRNKFTAVKTAKRRKKSSNTWLKRQINDPFVKQAKEEGFRSRSAFKIIEINDKFKIFKKGKTVLDLGAAPGGWSQVVVDKVGAGKVFAVDILAMERINGVEFLQQDFLAENGLENVRKFVYAGLMRNQTAKCDVIISDMAENTCGDQKTDHLRIVALLEQALEFAFKILAKDGIFIGKIFQGGADSSLLQKFRQNFTNVKHFKPKSSRKESAENYIIALGYKH